MPQWSTKRRRARAALLHMGRWYSADKPSNVVSDAATALYLAFAALKSAIVNVNINLKFIKDEHFVGEWAAKVGNLLAETEAGYVTSKQAIEAALEVTL